MNRQISPLEWQNLSDYLDNCLSPEAQKKLDTDLLTRPELKQALQDLRLSRTLLKSLPRRRAPKNFTLSAAALPRRIPAFPYAQAFGLASALCLFMLLFSYLTQPVLTLGLLQANGPAPLSKAAVPMAERPGSAEPTPQVFTWGGASPADGSGFGGGAKTDNSAQAQVPIPPSAPAAALAPTSSGPADKTSPAPVPMAAAAPPEGANAPAVEGSGPILGIKPTAEQGLETGHSGTSLKQTPDVTTPATSVFPLVQSLLVGLAVLFALSALVSWFKYYK